MPDPIIGFLPVVAENADSVRARLDADLNQGVAPGDPDFVDATEGGWWHTLSQPQVLEFVRLWVFIGTELPASVFPGSSWGDWLDMIGEQIDLPRDDETYAEVTVVFTGPVGTLIPAGTEVGTVQPDPSLDTEPVVFRTLASITLMVTPGPTNLAATPATTGGTMATATHYYRVTAVGANGETVASNEVQANTTGPTASVALAWTGVAGATAYRVYRGVVSDGEVFLAERDATAATYTDTGAVAPSTVPVPTNSVGARAADPGSAGNVAGGALSQVLSPIANTPTVTNPQAASGGSDVEEDDRYRTRILLEFESGGGPGTARDYVRWVLNKFPEVGYVTAQAIWNGAGTVRVIITDPSNNPSAASTVQRVQDYLDPVPQQGRGQAPIGALVTTASPSSVAATVAAHPTFATGYSLDGANGTIAQRATITAAIRDYVNKLPPDGDVVLNQVIARVVEVPGVLDVSGVTLNGVAANLAIGALQVAQLVEPVSLT